MHCVFCGLSNLRYIEYIYILILCTYIFQMYLICSFFWVVFYSEASDQRIIYGVCVCVCLLMLLLQSDFCRGGICIMWFYDCVYGKENVSVVLDIYIYILWIFYI